MGKLRTSVSVLAVLASTAASAQQQPSTVTNMPPASTPLSGSELLYLVQAGNPRKITVSQLLGSVSPNFPSITANTFTVGGTGGCIWTDFTCAAGAAYVSRLQDRLFLGYGTQASTTFATQNLQNPPGAGYLEREATLIVASAAGLGGTYDLCVAGLESAAVTPAYFSVSGASILSSSSDGTPNAVIDGVVFKGGLNTTQTARVTVNGSGAVVASGIVWHATPGNSSVVGDVLTATHAPGLPSTLTVTVTGVNVPFCYGHAAAVVNNPSGSFALSANAEYWEGGRGPGGGNTNLLEADLYNGGDFQPVSPFTLGGNYQQGYTRGIHMLSGGSANGTAGVSAYVSPITDYFDTSNNGGRGALKGFVWGLNSLYYNTTPLFSGAVLSVTDVSSIKTNGTGGVNGTAVYAISGGTCTTTPTINVTWTAGVLTLNSIANPGACSILPQNFATLAYVSGTATGWTGATIRYVPAENSLGLIAEAFSQDMRLAWFSSNGSGGDGSNNYGYVGAYLDSHVTDPAVVNGVDWTNSGTFISGPAVFFTPPQATRTKVTINTTTPQFQAQLTGNNGQVAFVSYNVGQNSVVQNLLTRSTSPDATVAVINTDHQDYKFRFADGTNFALGGEFQFQVAGAVSTGIIPTTFALMLTDTTGVENTVLTASTNGTVNALQGPWKSTCGALATPCSQLTLTSGQASFGSGPNGGALIQGFGSTDDVRLEAQIGGVPTPALTIPHGQTMAKLAATYNSATNALPTCVAGLTGAMAIVSDANAPTYSGTYAGGGATYRIVFCNGTVWKT